MLTPAEHCRSHKDAVAVKFWRLLSTLFLWRSDFWQTTTVPPWFCCWHLLFVPIRVPIIFVTENFLILLALFGCMHLDSFSSTSNAW